MTHLVVSSLDAATNLGAPSASSATHLIVSPIDVVTNPGATSASVAKSDATLDSLSTMIGGYIMVHTDSLSTRTGGSHTIVYS